MKINMEHQTQNNKHQQPPQESRTSFGNWYQKYYKHLLILPAIILLLSIIYLVQFTAKNGDIIYKDISLTGGTTITVFDKTTNIEELKQSLINQFPDLSIRRIDDIRTGNQKAFLLESKSGVDIIKQALESELKYKLTSENSSIEFSGESLSTGFYKQLRTALIIAFILMAIVVFIIFKTAIPSGAVILSAFADIIMTLAVINFLGFQLSTAGIIALLMLIGYSVDTDILLTARLLKSTEGTLSQRLKGAFNTGMTMTLTAIAAIAVGLFIISPISDVLKQMFTIILIGLVFDIFNTWVTNASILKWYMEVKHNQ